MTNDFEDISRMPDDEVEAISREIYELLKGRCNTPNEALDVLLSTYLSTLFSTCNYEFTDNEKDSLSSEIIAVVTRVVEKKVAESN